MQKLLSIAIPSYNSEAYLDHAVESLLPGGEEVEILIVDDGSKDATAEIADRYEAQYPGIVRAIHKENGGHGDAVMTGIRNATGLYFKVVDSDDWVDAEAYPKVLDVLRESQAEPIDLLVSDFIYDKVGQEHKHVMRYANALPQGRVFGWEEVGRLRSDQYILMHSVIYRTQMLRDIGLDLPKHTFYVDNLYVYVPMNAVHRMRYLDEVFYHYFIGRDDQSVQEQVMIRRIDQQLRVNRLMIEQVDLTRVTPRQKQRYMRSYLEIITMVSSVLLLRSGTPENLAKKRALWQDMRRDHPEVYRMLRWRLIGICLHLPGEWGRKLVCQGYNLARRYVGFN